MEKIKVLLIAIYRRKGRLGSNEGNFKDRIGFY